MTITTKGIAQFYTGGANIDANFGPWASTDAYISWLENETGLAEPKDGALIAIAKNGEVKLMIYQGDGEWKEVGNIDVEAINNKVANAENAAVNAAASLDAIDKNIERLMESNPEATVDDVLKNTIAATALQASLNKNEVEKMQILDTSDYDWAIGDANGNVLIACKNGHIFTDKFRSPDVNRAIVDLQKNNTVVDTVVADTIDFSEETDWISTARNYILKGDNTTLKISDDLGKTWKSSTNPVGQIVFVHWFSNGTCLICSPTKAYYTTDYENWTPSDIKDADGNTISISDSQWCFNMMNSYNSPVAMIGDKEFCMWGDYGHSSGYTARIWCSDDYGATIKCVLKNGYSMTTHVDGEKTLNITHFHHCMWDNIHKCYWITTGDSNNENQLIKGTYEDNAWKFETVLSGNNAKFIMVWADETYLYALTDYTTGIQTGLLRCPLNRISDINNWKFIWSPENNECLGNMFADAEGNMVITGDDATWKKFWYANRDVNFKAIENTSNLVSGNFCIHYLVGPNYNGDVIASLTTYGWTATKAQCGWNVSKRVIFSKAMRNAGAKDFGKCLDIRTDKASNEPSVIDNVWKGKKIAWYGTSIPAGYPNQNNQDVYAYPNIIASKLGASIQNYCVPNGVVRSAKSNGATLTDGCDALSFTKTSSAINYQNSLVNLIGTDNEPDLFVFDYGVNDYGQDETDTIDYTSRDTKTFVGAMGFILEKLYEAKPDARVVLLTHYSDDGVQTSGHYGKNIWKPLNEMIKGVAEYWGVKLIDARHLVGWHNTRTTVGGAGNDNMLANYVKDGIHPAYGNNVEAVKLLANVYYNELIKTI